MAREDFERFIEELKARASVEDVISQYVTLKRNGNRSVGLCPFHSEKTGSFTVYSDSQSYYCFGCGKGGDVITFIRTIENLDYMDAVHFLADRYGLQVPEKDGSGEYRARRAATLKINKAAAKHFHDTLMSEAGKEGLRYLTDRKLTLSTIRHFGLGFAADSWNDLLNALTGQGFSPQEIEAAGLALRSEKGRYYDRFRGRVMFPIIDTTGNVIAFSGRVLPGAEGAKYINSPDTPAFKKSQVLFGLNFAKNAPGERLLLCEGNMDVVSLHQAGFTFAVASCGTAATAEHARLMARYAKEVVLAMDADEAGQKAMKKASALLEDAGLKVRVLQIPDAKDPDEYIKKFGAERFARLINDSGTRVSFDLERLRSGRDLSKPAEMVEYLKAVSEVLAGVTSSVEREVYIAHIAGQTGISPEAIRAEIKTDAARRKKAAEQKQIRAEMDKASGIRDPLNPEKRGNLRAARAEEGLIAVLLKHPDYYKKLDPAVTPEDFITAFNRNIFALLLEEIEERGQAGIGTLAEKLTTDEVARLTQYAVTRVGADDEFKLACDYARAILAAKGAGETVAESSPDDILKYINQNKGRKREEKSNG